ncbi:ComF family protein [Parapedobacter sp. DT-150]|uniref:ComF family protein n=1 Tax=Parapedobacter sp. DT-150 TaxID=3396162 RepID=UPI003F1A4613
MPIKRYLQDLVALFFPQTCAGCDVPLVYGEHLICTDCWYHMPYTHGHKDPDNISARQLWGRVPLEAVASYVYFRDSSRVQQIIHHFKYRDCPAIGTLIGARYGELLCGWAPFNEADLIVPVPLYPANLRKRGYNQSAFFAAGLSQSMQRPVIEQGLVRHKATGSQTRKNRYARYENMEGAFELRDPEMLAGKHVLLVDDVLTTGATITACASALLDGGVAKVTAVTIAKAL